MFGAGFVRSLPTEEFCFLSPSMLSYVALLRFCHFAHSLATTTRLSRAQGLISRHLTSNSFFSCWVVPRPLHMCT